MKLARTIIDSSVELSPSATEWPEKVSPPQSNRLIALKFVDEAGFFVGFDRGKSPSWY